MSDEAPWRIVDVDEDELIEVRRPAGKSAIARVLSVDRSGDGIVTLRIEPGEAAYSRPGHDLYTGPQA